MPYTPPPSRGADNFDSSHFGQTETARRLARWEADRKVHQQIDEWNAAAHERAQATRSRVISRSIR